MLSFAFKSEQDYSDGSFSREFVGLQKITYFMRPLLDPIDTYSLGSLYAGLNGNKHIVAWKSCLTFTFFTGQL